MRTRKSNLICTGDQSSSSTIPIVRPGRGIENIINHSPFGSVFASLPRRIKMIVFIIPILIVQRIRRMKIPFHSFIPYPNIIIHFQSAITTSLQYGSHRRILRLGIPIPQKNNGDILPTESPQLIGNVLDFATQFQRLTRSYSFVLGSFFRFEVRCRHDHDVISYGRGGGGGWDDLQWNDDVYLILHRKIVVIIGKCPYFYPRVTMLQRCRFLPWHCVVTVCRCSRG
mmetsp:Transcript_13532/g.27171  ORF Transcript_13532/g.27171 Transcript_13532/m.27171 type:complete len:227 (+) Transcript_13532:68-748(+)